MTLDELSPWDRRRERIGRQLEMGAITKREHARELKAIEREERKERIEKAAKRAREANARKMR